MQDKIIRRLLQKTTCIIFIVFNYPINIKHRGVTSVLLHSEKLKNNQSSSKFRIHFKDYLHHPKWQDFPAQPYAALPEKLLRWWGRLWYEEICQVQVIYPEARKLKTSNGTLLNLDTLVCHTIEKKKKTCSFFAFLAKCISLILTNTFLKTVCGKQNSLEECEQLLTFPSIQVCTDRKLQNAAGRELGFSI